MLAVLWTLGCRPEVNAPAELPIGLISTEITGLATSNQLMAQKLFERINAHGGLEIGSQAYRLVLRHQVSGHTPEAALESAQRLFNQHHVAALVGPNVSSFALPVAGLAERVEVPMIAPSATLPAITRGKRFVFRVAPDDDQLARLMAQFVRREMPDAKVAVLFEVTNDYSRAFAKTFQREMVAGGCEVVMADYTQGEMDFRPALETLRQHAPDALLLPNYAAAVQLQLEHVHGLDWPIQILGTDAWYVQKTYDAALYDGALIARLAHLDVADSPLRADLLSLLEGTEIWADDSVIMTYDALHLLFDALQRCACIDGAGIRDALASTRGFHGVSGEVSFAPGGGVPGRLAVVQVAQGQTSLYRALTDASVAEE